MSPRIQPDIVTQLRTLAEARRQHVEAIDQIDGMLDEISKIVLETRRPTPIESDPAPKAPGHHGALAAVGNTVVSDGRPRKYVKLNFTAVQFLLDLLRHSQSMTALEINRAWRGIGRGGVANNVILRMLKQGLIVRRKDEGQRGSRYSLNPNDGPGAPQAQDDGGSPSTCVASTSMEELLPSHMP